MQNHYFDDTQPQRPYTHSLFANPGSQAPANALRGEAPDTSRAGYRACESDGAWIQVEDHRNEEGWLKGEQHTIKELGPYPAGWSTTPPPVPLAEALKNARTAIFNRRRQAEYSGFMFDGQRWDSEEKDELRLNSMITMMDKTGLAEFPGWKVNADTFITLTSEIAVQAAAGLMGHYAACFQVEAAKNEQLAGSIGTLGDAATGDDVQAWLDANLDTEWPGAAG